MKQEKGCFGELVLLLKGGSSVTLNAEGREGDGQGGNNLGREDYKGKDPTVYRSCKRPEYLSRMSRPRQ